MMPLGSRARRVYRRHTQQNAIAFADDVIRTFPFRLHTVRTDRGHACQALLHWHLADQGIQHVSIKPRTPQLNGKVERSHRTDQQECSQLLSDKGDVDLEQRLAKWERFYNFGRPHGAFAGRPRTKHFENGYSHDGDCPTRSVTSQPTVRGHRPAVLRAGVEPRSG